ncbi:RNA ligase family protein [Rhizobium leguminosarum]|nr:RNA ligase family protein [Rhizobium leguminosarum]WHO80787.1 RNA ligase family protein [Rhizobium leguminosarum]
MIGASAAEDADPRMDTALHCAIANGYAFITMKKYGRTYHLPISPGATSDDKVMAMLDGLMIGDLVITEKMDGENTTIYRGGSHARSPDSRYHSSRDWLKAFAASISPQLADGERIVGENLYARHSIGYDDLPSYFLGFAWIIDDEVQSWDLTQARFKELGIVPVSTLYRGPYKAGLFEDTAASLDKTKQEGFVVRIADAFLETEMPVRMGKYVRDNHVQSETHWMQSELIPNRLANS